MKLKPSAREKIRYVVFEAIARQPVTAAQAYGAIQASLLQFAGQASAASMSFAALPKLWNSRKQRGMLKVHRRHVDTLRAAFALVRRTGRKKLLVRSVGVSGMIRKAQERYL